MSVAQLDTENADRDLTSLITVLTDTPDASLHMLCQGYVKFGDGAKDLDGSGGGFEFTITVGGQTVQPNPQTVNFDTATRCSAWTTVFPVVANEEVIIRVKSPNAVDTDVDVTAYLFDVSAVSVIDAEVDNDGAAISLAGALKLLLSVCTGKSSGGGTATLVFRDIADSKNRVSVTVDSNGNRTAVGTRDAT